MIGALYILAFLIVVGALLYAFECRHRRRHPSAPTPEHGAPNATDAADAAGGDNECCGMHIVCEKDTLIPFTTQAEYYDYEELDRFAGRAADAYTDDEIEEFRDVLLTLRSEEVAGWARSIALRGITLPAIVKEELLLLVAERRAALTSNSPSA